MFKFTFSKQNSTSSNVTETYKAGDTVKVRHKGKTVNGKIVRYDDGGSANAKQHGGGWVVDVGEPQSITIPEKDLVS